MKISSISLALSKAFQLETDDMEQLDGITNIIHNNTSDKDNNIPSVDSFIVVRVNDKNDSLSTEWNLHSYDWIITNWSRGLIVSVNDTIRIYDLIDGNIQMNKIINLSNNQFIIKQVSFLKTITFNSEDSEYLFYLTSDNYINILDIISGSILFKLKLPFKFSKFQHVDKNCNLIALYSNSSYFAIVQFDPINQSIKISSLIYLTFWPIGILRLNRNYLYVIGSNGKSEIFQYISRDQSLTLIKDRQHLYPIHKILWGDPSFGKLLEIYKLEKDCEYDTWLFLQETGWTIYQLIGNKMIDQISSPLISKFEKFIHLNKDIFIIWMASGNAMFIEKDTVRLIDNENKNGKIIDVLNINENLYGLFKDTVKTKFILKKLNLETLSWASNDDIPLFNANIKLNSKFYLKTEDFEITISDQGKAILKNLNGVELGSFTGLKGTIVEVIDINLVINNNFSLKHYLILNSELNVSILVFDQNLEKLLERTKINEDFKVSSISYYETLDCLEFKDENQIKSMYFRINDLTKLNNVDVTGLAKTVVFALEDSIKMGDLPYTFNNWIIDGEITMIPLNYLISDKNLMNLQTGFNRNCWLGIATYNPEQTIVYHFEHEMTTLYNSPELVLLYVLVNPDKLLEVGKLMKNLLKSKHFTDRLCQFCMNSNKIISSTAIDLLYCLLSNDKHGSDDHSISLFVNNLKILSSDSDTLNDFEILTSTILVGFCVSVNGKLYNKKVSKILIRNILQHLTSMNRDVCNMMFQILNKMGESIIFDNIGSNCYNVAEFFNIILQLRSKFLSDEDKKCFESFKLCNAYLDTILTKDPMPVIIILTSILDDRNLDSHSKISSIDYLNYVLLEKCELITSTMLLLLLNSLIVYLMILHERHFFSHDIMQGSQSTHTIWENINLTLNLLTSKFSNNLCIKLKVKIGEEFSDMTDLKNMILNKKEIEICLILEDATLQLGYTGVLYRFDKKGWKMVPLKSSNNLLKILDEGNENDLTVVENLQKGMGINKKILKPVFSKDGSKIAVFNFEHYYIIIWDANKNIYKDNLNLEVFKNDNIPLKIADFSLLFLQAIWNAEHLSQRFKQSDLLTVIKDFQNETRGLKQENSSKSFADTPLYDSPNWYSDLMEVAEPIGKLCFGDLLYNYRDVFINITYDDLSLEWVENSRVLLKLRGKIIYVYNLP